MNILISGASGLIGSALKAHLTTQGHRVYTLSRDDDNAAFYWCPSSSSSSAAEQSKPLRRPWQVHRNGEVAIDAVVHLAGERIDNGRWNVDKKQRIRNSRIDTTTALVNAFAEWQPRPKVLLSASAIGFYGNCGDREVDETTPPGNDFLADLARDWENAANAAEALGVRVVNLRTGLVLSPDGGALAKMVTPFKLAMGGAIGDGKQWMSWVSLDEIVRMITFLLTHDTAAGAFNLVSPHAVTNAELTQALAQAVGRPAWLNMPKWLIKLLFGEMGELLLLGSIHVQPTRLAALGYSFDDAPLAHTLRQML